MSLPDDPIRDLSRIPRPSEPPSDTPDDLAKMEETDAARMADLTPQKRNTYLYERTIALLERRCADLIDEKNSLLGLYSEVRQQLDRLSPRHAALKQAYRDGRATNGLIALLMVLGGILVSVAGAISDPKWKERLLWAGGASFTSGFLFALQASIRNQSDEY